MSGIRVLIKNPLSLAALSRREVLRLPCVLILTGTERRCSLLSPLTLFSVAPSNQPSISFCCSKTVKTHMTRQELPCCKPCRIPPQKSNPRCSSEFKQLIAPVSVWQVIYCFSESHYGPELISPVPQREDDHMPRKSTQSDRHMLDLSLSLIGL